MKDAVSTVKQNIMNDKYYTPYCGAMCKVMPRTVRVGDQFRCPSCGWVSEYPEDFIAEYNKKWKEK